MTQPGDAHHTIWVHVVADAGNTDEIAKKVTKQLQDLQAAQKQAAGEARTLNAEAVRGNQAVVASVAERKKAAEDAGRAEVTAAQNVGAAQQRVARGKSPAEAIREMAAASKEQARTTAEVSRIQIKAADDTSQAVERTAEAFKSAQQHAAELRQELARLKTEAAGEASIWKRLEAEARAYGTAAREEISTLNADLLAGQRSYNAAILDEQRTTNALLLDEERTIYAQLREEQQAVNHERREALRLRREEAEVARAEADADRARHQAEKAKLAAEAAEAKAAHAAGEGDRDFMTQVSQAVAEAARERARIAAASRKEMEDVAKATVENERRAAEEAVEIRRESEGRKLDIAKRAFAQYQQAWEGSIKDREKAEWRLVGVHEASVAARARIDRQADEDRKSRADKQVKDDDNNRRAVRGAIDDLQPRMAHWMFIVSLVLTALVALIPVIAVVTGLLGVMLSTATAALAGFGVFALAAVGHIKDLATALKEAQKAGVPLTGQFAEVGAAWAAMKRQWEGFLVATQAPVFDVFARALEVVAALLPRLVNLANLAAGAFENVFDQIGAATASDTFAQFLSFAETQAPKVIESLSRSLLNVGEGLTHLVLAFGPFIDWFLKGLEDMTARFSDWAESLSTSQRFQDFMNYVMAQGPVVWDTLVLIVEAIIHLGEAMAPVGEVMLGLVRIIALLLISMDPDVVRSLVLAFVALYAVIKTLGIISSLVNGINAMVVLFAALRTQVLAATVGMTGFQRAAAGAGVAVATLSTTLGILGAVVAAISLLASAHDEAAESTRRHKDEASALGKELARNQGVVSQATQESKFEQLEGETLKLGFFAGTGGIPAHGPLKLTEAAERAGVDMKTLTEGALGNTQAFNSAVAAMERYAKERRDLAFKAPPGRKPGTAGALSDEALLVERAIEKYKELSPTADEAAAAQRRYEAAGLGATDATQAQTAATGELATVIADLAEKLKTAYAAYDHWKAAVEAFSDAQERQSDVERDALRSAEDALTAKDNALRNLIDRQNDAQRAQERLNEARRTAAERIQDLRVQVRDLAADEEGAALSLARAEENYRRTFRDPNATALDRREAALRLRQAQTGKQDQEIESERIRKDAAKAEREGVEGSRQVRDAIKAKLEADLAVIAATRIKTRAEQDYTEILSDNAEAVDDARRATKEAEKALTDSRLAYDLAANAAGKTAAEVERLKLQQEALDKNLVLNLSYLDKDDAAGRLRLIMQYMAGIKMLAGVSVPQTAWQQYRAGERDSKPIPAQRDPNKMYGRASGGAVHGSGGPTADDVPAWLSAGEHVWTAAEVVAAGGHGLMERLRGALRNGRIGQDEMIAFLSAARAYAKGGTVVPYTVDIGAMDLPGTVARSLGYAGGGKVRKPKLFDPAALYGGLDFAVRVPRSQTPRPLAAGDTVNNSTDAGIKVEQLTINNPVREPSDRSLRKSLQTLAYLGER